MKPIFFTLCSLFLIDLASASSQRTDAPQTPEHQISQLWGEEGKRWSPTSRLPDFSYCGYHYGEDPIPMVPVVANVTDFGADASDQEDDTAAFSAAIEHVTALPRGKRGAILIPAGTYIISDVVRIAASGIVLRGEGPEKTRIVFSDMEIEGPSFEEMKNNFAIHWNWRDFWKDETGKSWASTVKPRGFIFGDTALSKNIWRLPSPDKVIQVPIKVAPGYPDRGSQFIQLGEADFKTFQAHFTIGEPIVLAGKVDNLTTPDGENKLGGNPTMLELTGGAWGEADADYSVSYRQELRITKIENNKVFFDRSIRIPYGDNPAGAAIYKVDREYTECGIESCTLAYSDRAYISHFMVTGREPLNFEHTTRHCWGKNLVFENVDNGIITQGRYITLRGLTFNSNRQPTINPEYDGIVAHHLISLHGSYNLVEDFVINCKSVHDLTLSNSMGCIFSHGRGQDINFDHHRQVPYENLFSDIDVGAGTRLFFGTGNTKQGVSIGAYNTYWNIRSKQKQAFPDNHPAYSFSQGAGLLNLIGLNSDRPSLLGPRRWIENISPSTLYPSNIYHAQRARRLNK